MNTTVSRRLILTFVISLVVYALACFSPVSWSPNSEWLAFTVLRGKEGPGPDGKPKALTCEIWAWNMPDERAKLLREGRALSAPAFTPDGKAVVFVECGPDAVPAEKEGDKPRYPAQLLSADIGSGQCRVLADLPAMSVDLDDRDGPSFHWFAPSFSPDGKSVACLSGAEKDGGLVWVDCASGKVEKLALTGMYPRWSPDGKWVCLLRPVADWRDDPPAYTVEAMRPDGGERVFLGGLYLAKGAGLSSSWPNVSWAPDSKRVAYTTCLFPGQDGQSQEVLYVAGLDGSRTELLRGDKERLLANPVWSPNGRQMAMAMGLAGPLRRGGGPSGDREFGSRLVVLDVESREMTPLTEAWPVDGGGPDTTNLAFTMPAWSPDGRWIAVRLGDGPPMILSTDGKTRKHVVYDDVSALQTAQYLAMGLNALQLQKRSVEARREAEEILKRIDHWINTAKHEGAKEELEAQKLFPLLVLNRFEDVITLAERLRAPSPGTVERALLALGKYDQVPRASKDLDMAKGLEKMAAECKDPIEAAQLWLRAGDVWYEQLLSKQKAIDALTNVAKILPNSPEAKRAQQKIAEIRERFGE